MDFDAFMTQAWDQHADDPDGVARRIVGEGLPALQQADQVTRLAHLAHHVLGEHLGRWAEGLALQHTLAALPTCTGDAAAAVRRYIASLALAGGDAAALAGLAGAPRARVLALAAGSLGTHDALRAGSLLREAVAVVDAAAPADDDPALRALAITGNNLACTLEELAPRSDEQRETMILAAQVARRFWARAGTWLEIERAEYRLAMSWLQAGDPARAREHALLCLTIVEDRQAPALERFFGWEALATVDRARGDAAGHTLAVGQMREAFDGLDEADRAWCQASLDKVATMPS